MNLSQLKALFVTAGCTKLYAKPLAENDNSKNQVYFGPDFQALNLFPNEGILPDSSPKNPIFKARLRFGWLLPDGRVVDAPRAQLILYPQYPEVRLSGFLQGCASPPSTLMVGRILGRVLFLGVTLDRRIVAFVVPADSEVAAEFRSLNRQPTSGVFIELELPGVAGEADSRSRLLAELLRIHRLGWIDSKQLSEDGTLLPCNAPQCGGFTLEAELRIPKNSRAEPDFLGWEVKQHAVTSFERVEAGVITLMTPEPTGGVYKDRGPEVFVRRFGYRDKRGRKDRMNFGGIYRFGCRHAETHLTLRLSGFDAVNSKITDQNGAVALLTDDGEVAAAWGFAGLLTHWTRKHAKAAYVPSRSRIELRRQYAYGDRVRLAVQTDFLRFLRAMASGVVYYDPGIKVEHVSSTPKVKRRSQFRIASRNITALYGSVELVAL
ncbi:MAG TPA: MvaI/BcnI family restriction endonuclease [Verrucomicrobiae bacterium]|nr:MvaI/BcnI family restriction endonuclease [Verrucomicrobiae bacterium]